MSNVSQITNQPSQAETPDGSVARQTVIDVLEAVSGAGGFSVAVDGHTVTIVCNGLPEVQVLPDMVGRRLISRFANKYKIKIEYFYHPEMVHGTPPAISH